MKIVDKYGLAKEPNGTAFYVLDEYGNIGNRSEQGLLILESESFFNLTGSGKPFFNGVAYLMPDVDHSKDGLDMYEFSDGEPFCVDTDSSDFDDDDRFLVLDKSELGLIIKYLQGCYGRLPDPPVYLEVALPDAETLERKFRERDYDDEIYEIYADKGGEYGVLAYYYEDGKYRLHLCMKRPGEEIWASGIEDVFSESADYEEAKSEFISKAEKRNRFIKFTA